jgi:hypothetical protein
VLTDSSLKYYRDSTAEEVRCLGGQARGRAGSRGCGWGSWSGDPRWILLLQADELDGEIDLRSCTDVTEYAVQRNYGFQIHVRLRVDPGGRGCNSRPWAGGGLTHSLI